MNHLKHQRSDTATQKLQMAPRPQGGFTLIELLLYVAIVGTLLITVTGFFALTADSRIKNQSISEVNQQGTAVMETITQAIRNASAITAPATGTSSASLTLAMPTAGINPTIFNMSGSGTVMGYDSDGGTTDTSNSNVMNATKFTASVSGTITTLYAHIGPIVAANPNNRGQMALYSGTTAAPTTLLASSSDQTLTASTWNAFGIPSTAVTGGQIYWLAYNTNGTTSTHNNLRYRAAGANQSQWVARTYGTWPSSFPAATSAATENSMYTEILPAGVTGTIQIKEGAGATLDLANSKVEISGLSFKNLSRPGTPGVIQVSFTMSRASQSSKNEYDYQKTFTSTAAIR